MEFHAYHGCLPEERQNGARYLVDFSCEYDISAAAQTDDLNDTLNYAEVYEIVSRQMSKPSNLLENVAGQIAEAVSWAHPEASHIKVKVSKENPPVGGKTAWASVTVEF